MRMPSSAVIAGLGTCLPERVITNECLAARFDVSDAWIRSRTGISRRRAAEPPTSTGDLAVAAGRAALMSARSGADFVLLATTTPDRPCPATAPEVAHRLGLDGVPALDVSAVCSGFVYGLVLARALVASGACHRPLVIGAEVYTSIVDPLDRNTAIVFGDGAGAALLREGGGDEPGTIRAAELGSDGAGSTLIAIAAGGSLSPRTDEGDPPDRRCLRMRGREVYEHAVRRMTSSAGRVLELAGWPASSVRAFIGHQANQRILDAVGDRLGIDARYRFGNIDEVGNTAAASLPLAMADSAAHHRVPPGARSVLTAFGGGLTWGSAALTWPDVVPVRLPPQTPATRHRAPSYSGTSRPRERSDPPWTPPTDTSCTCSPRSSKSPPTT
ncbi:beta-ketoacyl-ACP synthase III [Streptomyces sp. NPDC020379]|uniref:beta-ketoacyl-ACP synthase III n=1 Tax=Streptomyces sp. NPDC020379 TaxID=3365071 RepID=UPI0037ADA79A